MAKTRKSKRLKASSLASKLMNYDVISFDIFDTLILRHISDPKDLFAFLAPKYNILDFGKVRVETENKLRKLKKEKYGNHEITINEIYDEIYKLTSIEPEIGIKNELEEEKNFCYANPYMKIVYDTLIQNGKKIIITSDMYLPHDLMTELLESCGYTGYYKLFVSCDYYCNKRDMGLYEYIKENYIKEDETVIHIGDNYETDFKNAQKIGWDSYYYRQCKYLGKPFDKIGMSFMIGSYYSSIVNNFLYNGINDGYPYNQMPYFYGYIYGGFYILGYVIWIHKKAVEDNMDKVIFLARDGYILKKVYDMIYDDIPSEYAFWSRQASLKASIKVNLDAYLWQFIKRRKIETPELTIEHVLKDAEFEFLLNKLEENGLTCTMKIGEQGVEEKLLNLVLENIEEIKMQFKKYNLNSKKYFEGLVGDSKNVAIIDIGWRGTGAMSLKYLFENDWKMNCQVKALLSGTYKMDKTRDSNFHLNKTIESYMFSPHINTDLLSFQQKNNKIKSVVLEMFSLAPMPSFSKYYNKQTNDFSLMFDIPEVENYEIINLISKGEIDFVKEYLKYIKNHPELLNIAGRDVYLPLKYLISGKKRFQKFKETFAKVVYNNNVGGLTYDNRDVFETFKEICKKVEERKK